MHLANSDVLPLFESKLQNMSRGFGSPEQALPCTPEVLETDEFKLKKWKKRCFTTKKDT